MEWGVYQNRIAVIALHKVGMEPSTIFKTLKKLDISRIFVYRTIKRYVEDSLTNDRPRFGRPRSVRTPKLIKAVKARIDRRPIRKQKVMAREMGISLKSMSTVIRVDLGLKAYRRSRGQYLTPNLMEQRAQKSKALLKRYAHNKHRSILFTDEKMFTIEEVFNRQNDRIYACDAKTARAIAPRVQRGHYPASVMVWWGVTYDGVTQLHFCEKGVKTSAEVYQNTILEPLVKPLNTSLFNNKGWSFLQDSAPAHKAKTTQQWLQKNVPDFISTNDWPAGSPDLNPLDYKLWSELENMACRKRHPNIDSLKSSLINAMSHFPIRCVRDSIDAWPLRLRACVDARGGHFE